MTVDSKTRDGKVKEQEKVDGATNIDESRRKSPKVDESQRTLRQVVDQESTNFIHTNLKAKLGLAKLAYTAMKKLSYPHLSDAICITLDDKKTKLIPLCSSQHIEQNTTTFTIKQLIQPQISTLMQPQSEMATTSPLIPSRSYVTATHSTQTTQRRQQENYSLGLSGCYTELTNKSRK